MTLSTIKKEHSWNLDTGDLHLSITGHVEPFNAETLLGAGSRSNPNRGFVFVSMVLGKHIGASPSSMNRVQKALARQIEHHDHTPIVFIGMAETAVGLGEGVFAAWRALYGPDQQAMYFSTTRYFLEGYPRVQFEEEHTHAPDLYLYLPDTQFKNEIFRDSTHVVLIDDEISTGNTLGNLVRALQRNMPDLLNVTAITLTDFSGGRAQAALARPGIRRAQVKSLLSGSFDFNVRRTFPLPRGSDYKGQECRRNLIPGDSVRLGQFQPTRVPDKTTDHLVSELVGASLVRVIATGEYMFPAQALGTELEKRGLNVLIHSTTRSPLRLDGDIVSITEVPDVYEEPVRNYIYNLPENLSEGEIRLLVHEVPTSRTVDEICRRLHARSVRL